MDESLRHFNPNPMPKANIFSKWLFCWLNPLFKKGRAGELEVDDMYNVTDDDRSDRLGSRLESEWMKEVKKRDDSNGKTKPSLLKALVRIFGVRYLLLGIIVFVEETTRVLQPLLLGALIRFFTPNSQVTTTEAYLYAMGVSLCAITLAVVHHPYFFGVTRMGMQMRVACCSLMYKKSLRLSSTAMGHTTTGQIVNLMSNDVNRFDQAVLFLHFLWIGPLQAIAVLVILWHELGPSVLAGFAVLLLLIPVQGSMGRLFSKLRRKTAVHTDERVKVMNEIIAGMRVIKMYCWEKPFGEFVEKIRRKQLTAIRAFGRLHSFRCALKILRANLFLGPMMWAIALTGAPFQLQSLYFAMIGFQAVSYSMAWQLSFIVSNCAELLVSLSRCTTFLLLDELDKKQSAVTTSDLRPKPDDCQVVIENLTAKWNPELDQNTLEKVSATVKAGQLLAVIGPVGAGKSSLLMAILKELQASSGHVEVKGKVSYVAQQAWVFSGSLRQNILFGSTYDKARFDKVVRASALYKDLEIMPYGDSTLIGDRGVSLSGGQRARVSLARALYTDADIFLLDDPLSAVDAAVGRHIFDKCIQGTLRNKPRILVTHQLQYLTVADAILILDEGRAVGYGTYEDLSNSGVDFAELLKSKEDEDEPVSQPISPTSPTSDSGPLRFVHSSHMSLVSGTSDFEPEPVQLPEEEERQKGTVGFRIYVEYFKAGAGIIKFLLLASVSILAQCTYIMSDWWLSRWSSAEEDRLAAVKEDQLLMDQGYNHTNVTIPIVDSHRNIYIFSGIIAAVFLFGMIRALLFFKVAVDASQTLHNGMFARILRVSIGFFDTNPVGRILNRFAKDVGHMDDTLPITFFDFVQCFLMILGIVLVAGFVNPWVFIPTLPLIGLFFYIRSYYLSTSRGIKRLEGTCRSPVFSCLSASLQGLHTIRAFSMEEQCQAEFDAHQDLHSEAWFLFLTTSRWLAVRLDWLCAIFVSAVTFCAVLSAGTLDAGLVGLSITYSMTLMGLFQWGVRQSAEVENQMISVERVLEYSKLPEEAALEEPEHRPPDHWPSGGSIWVSNLCLRYSPSAPNVLKNLTFRIKPREKVGIVGRTGAGKSSLITCLFRLVEPTGQVKIDDVDILKIGLHDLRKIISIIPQDPVLFTGTLRKNLDPFQRHSDASLWKALDEVQLKSAIEDLPAGLETAVSEGGVNFSVGQRQLICLARAILRRNRILMIDEATANVDPKTDELIQETIRDKFRDCTVLTIAHRLHTIMDSDRVMVLSEGQLVELEPPHLMLQRGSGTFYDMVQQTGKQEADNLAAIAAQAYINRRRDNRSSGSSGIESAADLDREAAALVNLNNSNHVGNAAKVKGKREKSTAKNADFDDDNWTAPLALAESFHSLLGHHKEDYDDDDDDDDDDGSDGDEGGDAGVHDNNANDVSNDGRGEGRSFATEASPDFIHSAESWSPVRMALEEDPVMAVHRKPSPPTEENRRGNRSHNALLNRSALTDTSLDDDVFAEIPSPESPPAVAARSNFVPTVNVESSSDLDGERSTSGSRSGSRSELLHLESGIGTDDITGGSDNSEMYERTESGLATQEDTPQSDDATPLQYGSDNRLQSGSGGEEGPRKSYDAQHEKSLSDSKVDLFRSPGDADDGEDAEAEDSSELDALIVPSSGTGAGGDVRS